MNIYNEIEKAKEAIQRSSFYDVKEVAEHELKKIYSAVEKTIQREEQEFKTGKDNDYFLMIVGTGFGFGLLTGITVSLALL